MGSVPNLTTWNGHQAYFQCSPWQVSFITPQHPVQANTAGNSTGLSSHPAQVCHLGAQSRQSSKCLPVAQKSTLHTTTTLCPLFHVAQILIVTLCRYTKLLLIWAIYTI